MSPPEKTHGSLVCIVSGSTSGRPHQLNLIGLRAPFTVWEGKVGGRQKRVGETDIIVTWEQEILLYRVNVFVH